MWGREFQLMDHDIGRNIQIFAHSFPEEDIEEDAQDRPEGFGLH